MVEAYALEHKLRPLRAVLTWKNRLTLYVEVPAAERNDEIVEWRWVRRLSIGMKPKLISMLVAWSICGCSSQESIHRLLIQFDAFRRAARHHADVLDADGAEDDRSGRGCSASKVRQTRIHPDR